MPMMKFYFIFCGFLAFNAIAYELPELGDSAAMVMSPKEETDAGRQVMQEIRADPSYFDDPDSVDFINRVGDRLLNFSHDIELQTFEFFILEDPTLNAFAMPGGFIGVHTGLILAASNESELASVLAHEISHVTQHHIARALEDQKNNLPKMIAAMAASVLAARSSPDGAIGGVVGAEAASVQAQLNFSRENEQEADRLGIERMIQSPYDPQAMGTFFTKLQQYGRFYEGSSPAFLHTHPLTAERLSEIQDRLNQIPYRQVQDGPDFLLIQARIRALVGTAHEALQSFEGHAADPTRIEDVPNAYGRAVALWRNKKYDQALVLVDLLLKDQPAEVFFEELKADIVHGQGYLEKAIAIYLDALKEHPDQRSLNYGYIQTLIDLHQNEVALRYLKKRLSFSVADYRLYDLQGQAYANAGDQMRSHEALANAYWYFDDPKSTLQQLQIAIRSVGGDFYEKSAIEVRIRQLKKELSDQKK